MDLNHIELTPSLVSALYSDSLVESQENKASLAKKISEAKPFNYSGQNQKNILLLLNYPDKTELTKQQQSFLDKMMKACGVILTDIVLLNLSQNPGANYKNLQE